MTQTNIPNFEVDQDSSHVTLRVIAEACNDKCEPRVVVDGGSTFGLACFHFHLPLVFPEGALVDGRAKLGNATTGPITLEKEGQVILVRLLKSQQDAILPNLESIQPGVFPLLEDDEEGQRQERLLGLEMLQRGVEAVRCNGRTTFYREDPKAEMTLPQAIKISKSAKTKVHEWFGPATKSIDEHLICRSAARDAEDKHWDEGMYLDNFVDEDDEIEHLLIAPLHASTSSDFVPNKNLASQLESTVLRRDLCLLLLELLLAYAYDSRTTFGEPTVESAWTIAVLSRSLVAGYLPSSENGDTIESILIGSIRRQLSYPLYRSWRLSTKVAEDVEQILREKQVQAALSCIHNLFQQSEDEAMAAYSADIIEPLMQVVSRCLDADMLDIVCEEFAKMTSSITKAQVGGNWNIEELEKSAEEAIREGRGGYI